MEPEILWTLICNPSPERDMKTFAFRSALLAIVLGAGGIASLYSMAALAAVGGAANAVQPPQLQQAYTWHDGKRERTVWLDPQLLAEFKTGKKLASNSAASAAPSVKAVYAQATTVGKVKGGVQLWRMSAGATSDQAAQNLTAKSATGATPAAYSPILRDSQSTSGRMRALPGNIIVYLNPDWDRAAVDAWALRKQLEIIDKLKIGKNVYVVKTQPGLAALTLANALYQSGEVVAAIPNWWQEIHTK
jgi:hypothetical protein